MERPFGVESAEDRLDGTTRWLLTLRYAAIPFVGWVVLLIVFWPGMMTIDSVWQWHQLDDVGLNNWHPFTYALLLGLLRRVVDTPALPLVLTIAAASLLLGRFAAWTVRRGRRPIATGLWLLLILLVPATALMPLVLWKDIVYGIALFGLTLIFWRIEDSDGSWLDRWANVGLLATSCLTLWLMRHNGWPVVVAILVTLLVLHRQRWRQLVSATVAVSALALLVTVPLASVLDVAPSHLPDVVLVHRVAMHIASGTPLTAEEREYLATIRSLDSDWPYSCSSIVPTFTPPNGFDPVELDGDTSRLASLVWTLTLRNPRAEIRHIVCSSQLLWRPGDPTGSTFFLGWSRVGDEINYIDDFAANTPVEASPAPRVVNRHFRPCHLAADLVAPPRSLHLPFGDSFGCRCDQASNGSSGADRRSRSLQHPGARPVHSLPGCEIPVRGDHDCGGVDPGLVHSRQGSRILGKAP